MIFAEFKEDPSFDEMVNHIKTEFKNIQYGQQGDSWIWIWGDSKKVEIDTFTSFSFQVKASETSSRVKEVLKHLQEKYQIEIYKEPILENHE